MIFRIRQIAKRTRIGIVLYRIFDNWRAGKRFNSGKIDFPESSSLKSKTLTERLEYIQKVFGDYLNYSGLSSERLEGARVLEVGHGDNFGVALMFLAGGAEQVVCLDKFYSELDGKAQRELYSALCHQLDEPQRRRFKTVIALEETIRIDSDKLMVLYGSGIEEAAKKLEPRSFDLIISRAVLEYSTDSDAAFAAMDQLLNDGGCMVHKIDLRDDGMFSSSGMNPLTFLTIPDFVYRLMTLNSGRCNRKLINYYREKMRDLGYEVELLITATLDGQELLPPKQTIELNVDYSESTIVEIQSIRRKLIPTYRYLPDEDLVVAGIFLIARKPSPSEAMSAA